MINNLSLKLIEILIQLFGGLQISLLLNDQFF